MREKGGDREQEQYAGHHQGFHRRYRRQHQEGVRRNSRPEGDDGNCGDWITAGNPYLALHGLPGDVLRTVSALSALGGVANPVAALANAANAAAG